MNLEAIITLKSIILSSTNITFFGGAGTSTESNIPDFRSENGLYSLKEYGVSPEVILSHSYFYEHPELFYDFLKKHLMIKGILPHVGHMALKTLESYGLNQIITQNIDGLHQKAGSKNVIELHGSLDRHICTGCQTTYDLDWILNQTVTKLTCPLCHHLIKPDVVLYGEGLDNDVMAQAVKALSQSDLLIVAGTSLVVYPAASFIRFYKGKNLVLINPDETPYDHIASLILRENFGEVFDALMNCLD